jgi:hypothetical protein
VPDLLIRLVAGRVAPSVKVLCRASFLRAAEEPLHRGAV